MAKQKIKVDDLTIALNKEGYISLTDIAKKNSESKPIVLIRRWLRTQRTLTYLFAWEEVHNPNFKVSQKGYFRDLIEDNTREVSPIIYIKELGGIGIVSSSGRYGGTYAHSDIALDFCKWIDPRFSVWVNKEFQRLKSEEAKRLNIEWNIRRELSKAHYPMLKEAVIQNLPAGKNKAGFYLADEADLINQLVFGMTAQQWRKKNPNLKGNMRDNATVEQLLLVSDLQIVDSLLLKWDCDKPLRTELLEKFASDLRRNFAESVAVQRIKEIQDRSLK